MKESLGFFFSCSFFSIINSEWVSLTVSPVDSLAKQTGFSRDSGCLSQLLYCLLFLGDKNRICYRRNLDANRRKLVKKKACILPDLDLELESNVYISESLTSSRINLFSGINKERKPLKWKHIWTQNGRIFIKEADTRRSYSFDSFEDLAKFRSSLRQ